MSVTGFLVNGQIQKYDYGSLDNLPDIPENSGTFWATYNSTSEAEITNAFSNNKSVMMKIGNDVFYVTRKLSIGPSGSAWLFVSVGQTNIRTTWVSGSYWNSFSTNTMGGEISNDLKQALLQLASKVVYIDEHGQTYYNDLYNALYPHELMSISATFNQGSNIIYDIDPLTVLNQYLTVVASYSDGTTETISSSDYTLSGNLLEGVSTITVYYEGFTDTFNVNVTHMAGYYTIVNNLTGCTTNNSATAIQENTSYTATITASAGYTLSGATVTITMGGNILTGVFSNGTISIPNVTGDLVITVVASAITVSSISAVYTQTGVVYTTDTLNSLKDDLVVTANYSDSTTAIVPAADYTLSGTLSEGTSIITVSYGGKTTNFNVIVTRYQTFDYAYNTNYVSANGWVDTGLTHSPSFNTLNIEFEAMNSKATNGSDPLICANNQNTSDTGNIVWYSRANKGGFSSFSLGVAKQLNMVPGDIRAVINYHFVDGGETYMEWNGNRVAFATMSKSSVAQNNKTLILAGGYSFSNGGKYAMEARTSKLGYVKFTDPDTNNLLYHFIPAHDLVEDKWGFYEVINSIFYPATGDTLRCANWET